MNEELNGRLTYEQAAQFLDRINLSEEAEAIREGIRNNPDCRPIEPTLDLLNKMVKAHQLSVPFENLDIYEFGKVIDLGTRHLFDKIVTRRRGGYCFELNKNFSSLLIALGYHTHGHLGRIHMPGGDLSPRLHRVNTIRFIDDNIETCYLADVGSGGAQPAQATLLQAGRFTDPYGVNYRLAIGMEDHNLAIRSNTWVLYRIDDTGDESIMVSFEDIPQFEVDFLTANFYTSARPESRFVTSRICNLRREDGHASISDNLFRLVQNGETLEVDVTDPTVRIEYLKEYFGIVL